MSAQHIAEHFRLIFSEYGWPDTLVSDNGPCYVAEVFTNLMKEYAVNHITSSPHYPNPMDWQRNLSKLSRISFTKQRMKEPVSTSV